MSGGSAARDSLVDSAGQVAVLAVSMGAGIVLARILGASGRGEYVLVTSLAGGLFAELAAAGMATSAQVFVAKDPARLARVHGLVLLASLLFGGAMAALCVFGADMLSRTLFKGAYRVHLWAIGVSLPFAIYSSVWNGIMVGLGRVRERAMAEVVTGAWQALLIVGALVACVLTEFKDPVSVAVYMYALTVIATGIAMFALLAKEGGRIAMPDRALVAEFVRYTRWVWVGNAASLVGQRLDQFVVVSLLSPAALGVYNLGVTLASRSSILAKALVRSLYARVAAAPAEEAADLCARGFRQLAVAGVGCVALGALGAPLLPLVYGEGFAAARVPFVLALVAVGLVNASRMFSMYYSGQLAKPEVPMAVNWVLLPAQFGLSWWLTSEHGVIGAGTAAIAGAALLCGVFGALFLRRAETPGAGRLLRLQREDVESWKRLLRRK